VEVEVNSMTATYELEMPTVKHPFIDAKRQDEILESKTEDDWIQFFKSLQFIDYREGRQTKSIYYKDDGGYYQIFIFNKLDTRAATFLGSIGEVQINAVMSKQLFDKMVNYVKYGETNAPTHKSNIRL
jgi:hypothetical protein